MCTGTSRGIEKIIKHLTAQIEITQKKMVRNSTNTNGFPGTCDICELNQIKHAFEQNHVVCLNIYGYYITIHFKPLCLGKTVFTTEKAYRQHKRDAPDCGGQSSSSNYRSPSKAGMVF